MKQVFEVQDFSVFSVDGLEERMNKIKTHIRPKLEMLGEHFVPFFTEELKEPFFYHVAKHARRTVNPPNDTWVAFAANKRGYKMMPHFQIGLWGTHLFIYFGLIYECPQKAEYAKAYLDHIDDIQVSTPGDFVWSIDHTKPIATPHASLSKEDLQAMFERLGKVKKAELLAGIHIPKERAIELTDAEFLQHIKMTFQTLLPLYKVAEASVIS
ncbi:YktB family protein [Microbacteriaceae bacterium 4G12]